MKYPQRGASLTALSKVLLVPLRDLKKDAEQAYALKLWDETFDVCITHDKEACVGIERIEKLHFGRCAPCERAHKAWRESVKGNFTPLEIRV